MKFKYNNIYTIEERKKLVGQSLKVIRKYYKLSQQTVAEEIGINTQTYSTYERGRNEPPVEILVRLSYLYDIPLEYIVQYDNFTKNENEIEKALEQREKQLEILRSKVISGDPETRAEIKNLTDEMSRATEMLHSVLTIISENTNK